MTATNHALTGAIIGTLVGEPVLAIPLAFVSHFAMDSIPHFGMEHAEAEWLRSKKFRGLLILEALLCLSLVAALYLSRSPHWLLAIICAFVATTPDLFWVERLKRALKAESLAATYRKPIKRLHMKIQWFQRPIGAVVELTWAAAAVLFLTYLIKS